METKRRLALLIDGDNAQAALLPQILDAVKQYGKTTIRCVYGDWSKPHMNSWKEASLTYALRTEHQFSYTKGKNATDIALTIGAMDFLHRHKEDIDGFCIVSSDSDFTPLVNRIREANLFVMGIGKKMAVESFRQSCHVFVYTDDREPTVDDQVKTEIIKADLPKENGAETAVKTPFASKQFQALFKRAIASTPQDDDGWAQLTVVGKFLQEFDPKYKQTYGVKGLSELAQMSPKFIETEVRKNKKGNDVICVRLKIKSKTENK